MLVGLRNWERGWGKGGVEEAPADVSACIC